MSTNSHANDFATEVAQRYDEFIAWTISQWPSLDDPLSPADFALGRKELSLLLDSRLSTSVSVSSTNAPTKQLPPDHADNSNQFLPVTPAPWP
jgi:hypothetical protein